MKIEFSLNCSGVYTDFTDSVNLSKFVRTKLLSETKDPTKTITSEVELTADSYKFVKDNLINTPNIYSNSICVRITDTDCGGTIYDFKIDNNALKWCDNDYCVMSLNLVEDNTVLDCIKTTAISDTTNGWFDPLSTVIDIPKFRYCDIIKPTFFFGVLITLFNTIDLAFGVVNAMFTIINGILGTSLAVPYATQALAGCERVHPAPFVKDYVSNVCNICNLDVDNVTSPILHEPFIDRDGITYDNEYYYACLFFAPTTKGLKLSSSKTYITKNRPSWTLHDLLSKIKLIFNARYFINNGKLYFERKDKIGSLVWGAGYQLDLTDSNVMATIEEKPCYQWNGKGKPKRLNYVYGSDATDTIGNEMLKRFNGEYLEPSTNPNYKEMQETNVFEFGSSAFVMDGQDSLWDGTLTRSLASIFTGNPYEGALKMQTDTAQLAKILIWNRLDLNDAMAVKAPYDVYGSVGADIQAFQDDDANFFPISSADCYNVNFPMSFDPDANGLSNRFNLWEFHKIDVPNDNTKTNISFTFKLRFCCNYNSLDLYQKVKLNADFDGEINEIEFNHSEQIITVKGNLI